MPDENENRLNGYYWVRDKDVWYVANFIKGHGWSVPGGEDTCWDYDFEEINETRLLSPVEKINT